MEVTTVAAPVSLSEILQTLDTNLPEFLASLKRHGFSLKEFTDKLQAKKIKKMRLQTFKNNIEKLFKLLNGSVENNSQKKTSNKPKSLHSLTTVISLQISSSIKPNPSSPPSSIVSSTEVNIPKSQNIKTSSIEITSTSTEKPKKDIIFGSKTGGFLMNKSEATTTTSATTDEITTEQVVKDKKKTKRPGYNHPRDRIGSWWLNRPGLVNNRLSSTERPTLRPPYVPKSIIYSDDDTQEITFGQSVVIVDKINGVEESIDEVIISADIGNERTNKDTVNESEDMELATRSAIMAASILGGVAFSVFIAIFIVVKYKNYVHKNKKRNPGLSLSSDSSSSTPSLPPIYTTRSDVDNTTFWDSWKSSCAGPSSLRDPYYYSHS